MNAKAWGARNEAGIQQDRCIASPSPPCWPLLVVGVSGLETRDRRPRRLMAGRVAKISHLTRHSVGGRQNTTTMTNAINELMGWTPTTSFRPALRAMRPQVGDTFRRREGYAEPFIEVIVTDRDVDMVQFKRVCRDGDVEWEKDAPAWVWLDVWRRWTLGSLRRGCEFIPANTPARSSGTD